MTMIRPHSRRNRTRSWRTLGLGTIALWNRCNEDVAVLETVWSAAVRKAWSSILVLAPVGRGPRGRLPGVERRRRRARVRRLSSMRAASKIVRPSALAAVVLL